MAVKSVLLAQSVRTDGISNWTRLVFNGYGSEKKIALLSF